MRDQASKLRSLVSRDDQSGSSNERPRRIVLFGSKGGVGTTTLAINFAVAMKKLESEVVLVDAASRGGDIATVCDLCVERGLEGVLRSQCDWNAAAISGPMGISVVAQGDQETLSDEQRAKQLSRKLQSGLAKYECVLVDAGNAGLPLQTILREADTGLLISTPDHVAMTRSYRIIRQIARQHSRLPLLVINRVRDVAVARDMAFRLSNSAERMLNRELDTVLLHEDGLLETNLAGSRPAVCVDANAVVSQQILHLAEHKLLRVHRKLQPTGSETP